MKIEEWRNEGRLLSKQSHQLAVEFDLNCTSWDSKIFAVHTILGVSALVIEGKENPSIPLLFSGNRRQSIKSLTFKPRNHLVSAPLLCNLLTLGTHWNQIRKKKKRKENDKPLWYLLHSIWLPTQRSSFSVPWFPLPSAPTVWQHQHSVDFQPLAPFLWNSVPLVWSNHLFNKNKTGDWTKRYSFQHIMIILPCEGLEFSAVSTLSMSLILWFSSIHLVLWPHQLASCLMRWMPLVLLHLQTQWCKQGTVVGSVIPQIPPTHHHISQQRLCLAAHAEWPQGSVIDSLFCRPDQATK